MRSFINFSRIKYYLDYQVKVDEIGRACGMYGGRRSRLSVLVGKRERKRQLGRYGHRWVDNI
jgi:hypothetical protein